jgi:2-phosphoglycerate kinase
MTSQFVLNGLVTAMLYLIGGAPRCGKTTLARHLAQALCCSYVPVDYLGTAFATYIPAAELPQRYPAWRTASVDERFATYTTAQIIATYRTKAATVWPGLRAFCEYALVQRHPLVLDGYQLEPRFIHELLVSFPQFPIAAVVLTRTHVERIRDDLTKGDDPDDWVRRSTTQAGTFTLIAEMVSQYSQYFAAEAAHYHLASFDMDVEFHAHIANAMIYLQRRPSLPALKQSGAQGDRAP